MQYVLNRCSKCIKNIYALGRSVRERNVQGVECSGAKCPSTRQSTFIAFYLFDYNVHNKLLYKQRTTHSLKFNAPNANR